MINYQTITIDLQPDYREPVVQMYLSERDVGRPIQVNVLMQGQPYSFTAGTTVHIDLRKPSGHVVQVNGNYAVGSNVVLFNVVEQMAAEPGMCLTELSIVGDGQDPIGSKNWLTKVELSPMHAGDPSETWIEDLDELVQDAMEGHIDATLSIPGDAADAAAVGEELADLKSAISKNTIQILNHWEQGNINYSDGTEQASTTACRSSVYYVPTENTVAVISNPNSHTVAIRRWLANGTYDGTDTVTNWDAFMFLPGYKYRAVDVSTGNPADVTVTFTVKSALSVPNIYSDINGFKQDVLNTDNLLILSELMAEGMYYHTRPVADATCTFFKVPVTVGVTYNFGSAARYVSKDGAVLASSVYSYTVSASDGNYVYVTFFNANRANWAICESTVDISTVGTYDNPVIKQGALKVVYDSIEYLENTVDADIEYDGYQRVIPEFTDGMLISRTSGSEFSAQNYSATDYISVREYMKYTIVTKCGSDTSGYSFYDENHAVIWGQFGGLYEAGAGMHSFTVTAPRKSKYIRFSCLTVNKADSYFVTEDLIGSLENYTDKQIVRFNTPVYWTSKVNPPYWIFLLDAARKYFTIANIKTIIDLISAAGFNQFMMHFSTDTAFRLELADMSFVVNGTTYDLSQCLGGVESPNLWYDQDNMDEIISYCHTKGIDFVPLFDMPGHMGKILSVFTSLRYPGTTNLLNIKDSNAVAFAKAVADRYTKYFASRGCHCYNMGYDELPNLNSDTDTNGFQDLYNAGEYHYVVDFGNDIADLIKQNGLIPRIFNEAVYFENDYKNQFSLDFEVMHWFSQAYKGNTSAQALQNYNYKLINTSFFLYWILGNPSRSTTVEYIDSCDLLKQFYGGTLAHNAYGATLCAWCDGATDVDAGDGGDGVVNAVTPLIVAFGNAIDRVLNA